MKLSEAQALNRLASYCSRGERCEYDIRKKLTSWELNQQEADRLVNRLKEERFINEERFCRSFINDKLRFNKWGKTKITFELRKRNIPASISEPLFEELGGNAFEEQLLHILKIKARTVKGKDERDRKNKLIRFALGRGFSMDLSIKCVNKILGGANEEYPE